MFYNYQNYPADQFTRGGSCSPYSCFPEAPLELDIILNVHVVGGQQAALLVEVPRAVHCLQLLHFEHRPHTSRMRLRDRWVRSVASARKVILRVRFCALLTAYVASVASQVAVVTRRGVGCRNQRLCFMLARQSARL